jgi:hypothetical protein
MPATPTITLTATLQDFCGNAAGTAANPAKLRIALCMLPGQGQVLPAIAGTANIAQMGPWYYYDTGSGISLELWGNDVISPQPGPIAITYYEIAVIDGEGNMVQVGAYQFEGTLTIDLSEAPQIYPTPPPPIPPPSGSGITQLVGDVTAGPGTGTVAASVVKIRGCAVGAYAVPVTGTVAAFDVLQGLTQVLTLGANLTSTITGAVEGLPFTIMAVQGSGGGGTDTLAWPAGFENPPSVVVGGGIGVTGTTWVLMPAGNYCQTTAAVQQ